MEFVSIPDVKLAADVSTGEHIVETPWGIYPARKGDVLVRHGNKTVPIPGALWGLWFEEGEPEPEESDEAEAFEQAEQENGNAVPEWARDRKPWYLEMAKTKAAMSGEPLREPNKQDVFDHARAMGLNVDASMRKDEIIRVIDESGI